MEQPFTIDGLHWRKNWRIENGQDSYVVPFPTLRPATLVFHGETAFSYGHYGIHLGQADVLTFLGPSSRSITGHFIDCREGSPTAGVRETRTWSPSSGRALHIPNGVAHTFDGLESVYTLNTYDLYLPDLANWASGAMDWRPEADIINVPLDVSDAGTPRYRPNAHPAGELWYDLVASRQKALIPGFGYEYPATREVTFADGRTRRVEFKRRVERTTAPGWEPVPGVAGVGWQRHPVVPSGPDSGFSALLDRYPLYFIDHGETLYTHDAYGIHLGQEDHLTFVGPRSQTVTVHLMDTRTGSPTFGAETSYSFHPDPTRYLMLPPGVAHAFEHLENVFTVNRPRILLPEGEGAMSFKPGNDVIDWPLAKRPVPAFRANEQPAPAAYYEGLVADQKKLQALPPAGTTPAVMVMRGPDGKEIRVRLRKKLVNA